jgi:type I restriction enzyme, S subunit
VKFKSIKVSAVADPILGGTPKRSESRYWGGDIKWASAKDVAQTSSRYITETLETITEEGVKHSAAKVLPKDTIVITARGTVGEIRLLGQPMAFNQSCYGLVSKDNIDNMYLFYALKNITDSIKSASYGTVFDTITKKNFDLLEIPYPSYEEQIKISSILDSLDRKIELNQKMNTTLEEMAMTLYKHWLVDFGPFQDGEFVESELGMIPKGWRVSSLKEFANILMGQSPKSEFYNRERKGLPFHQGVKDFGIRYPVHTVYCTQELRVAKKGDILLSVRAPVGRINIANTKLVIGRGLSALHSKSGHNSFLLYTLKRIFSFEDQYGSGTVFNSINKKDIEQLKFIQPPQKVLDNFENHVSKFDALIEGNTKEIEELQELRDYLLPRLLSGEIDVSKAEKQVEEVL